MKKINKYFYILFIVIYFISILFIYFLSNISNTINLKFPILIFEILACFIIIIGIFTDTTYIFKKNIIINKKNKEKIFISSILSTIFLILSSLQIINITNNNIEIIINSIMSILSFVGILNKPSTKLYSIKYKLKKLNLYKSKKR